MENEEMSAYYGGALAELKSILGDIRAESDAICGEYAGCERSPIEHCKTRIKTPASARAKLRRMGLPDDAGTALRSLHDVAGARLVCTFPDSVYLVSEKLGQRFEVVETKDYIRYPKPNGYRSLHMILRFPAGAERGGPLLAEIQLRTIAMDCWASLEHQLKYKKNVENQQLIVSELRRCAETLASADLMMQTINEMIGGGESAEMR